MPIVSSVIAINDLQADGRRVIREVWIDDQGNQFTFDYMADAGTDIAAKMAARSDQVLAASNAVQIAAPIVFPAENS